MRKDGLKSMKSLAYKKQTAIAINTAMTVKTF